MASIPDPPGLGGDVAGPDQDGGYDVGAVIREGWGGTIHEGHYRRSGLRVTIQDVRPDLAAIPALIDRLGEVGRQAATVHDPHLLAVYDLVDDDGAFRLVAEWCAGPALAATLGRGALPPAQAMAAVLDVLAGLSVLHAHGLFHGQVGPETVVVDGDGRARLAELALCAAAAPPGFGPHTDVRDAARLGLHLLRNAGQRFEAVRRPLEAAATGDGAGDAGHLRDEVEAAATSVLGNGWRDRRGTGCRREHGGAPRHRRRVLVVAALGAVAVAAAVVAGIVFLGGNTAGGKPSNVPLSVGTDAALGVTPSTGSCNSTFTFIGRGSLTGTGTLVYRWEQSDGQATADTSLPITPNEGAFQLTQAWRLQGSQKVSGTMTLHILKPVGRKLTRPFTYSCP